MTIRDKTKINTYEHLPRSKGLYKFTLLDARRCAVAAGDPEKTHDVSGHPRDLWSAIPEALLWRAKERSAAEILSRFAREFCFFFVF